MGDHTLNAQLLIAVFNSEGKGNPLVSKHTGKGCLLTLADCVKS